MLCQQNESINSVVTNDQPNNFVDFIYLLEDISQKYKDKLQHLKQVEEISLKKIEKAYKQIIVFEESEEHNQCNAFGTDTSNSDILITRENSGLIPPVNDSRNIVVNDLDKLSENEGTSELNPFGKFFEQRNNSDWSVPFNDAPSIKQNKEEKCEFKKMNDVSVYDNLFLKFTSRYAPGNAQKEMWQKQITVPEPFKFSQRANLEKIFSKFNFDDSDSVGTLTYSRPVPASSKLPLYELITIEANNKRQQRIEEHKQKLIATVQPFNLSMPNKTHTTSVTQPELKEYSKFKASAIPESLFAKCYTSHVKDLDEALRKIRIKSRADEMLKKSLLPFRGSLERKWKSSGCLAETETLPQKRSSEHNSKNLGVSGQRRMHPGVLRQKHIICNSSVSDIDNVEGHETLNESTVDKSRTSNSFSDEKKLLPNYTMKHKEIKSTRSTNLREMKLREAVQKESLNIREEIFKERSQKEKEKQYHNDLGWKFALDDSLLYNEQNIKDKILSLRKSSKLREQEYQEELEKMKERVKGRPMLFDRQSEFSAKQSALRKIQQEV